MDTLCSRLTAFQDYMGLTNNAFATKCGINPSNYSKMIRGQLTFTTRSLVKIGDAFRNLNTEWLMTGEGEMLNSADQTEIATKSDADSRIPLIPASAFAGGVEGFAPESLSLRNCESVISPVSGAEFAIPITGDSMEPDYADGSIAYIRRINEAAFIPWGHTVVLDTENGAFIKRIYPDDNMDDYIWARSINPAYPPMHIPKKSIFRIFRVLGTSRIFTTM